MTRRTAMQPDSVCCRGTSRQARGQSARNTRIARIRARVEHVFAAIEAMGGKTIRTIGQARADFALTLMAACYTIRRTVWLVKSGAILW